MLLLLLLLHSMEWKRRWWTSGTQPGGRTYFENVLVYPKENKVAAAATEPLKRPHAQPPQPVDIPLSQMHLKFEVKQTADKGRSLFAKVALTEHSRFEYTGKRMDEKELGQLQRLAKEDTDNKHGYMDYVCDSGDDNVVVDGHPRHGCIAFSAMANEPSVGQADNLAFGFAGEKGARYPILVTIAPIAAGDELLVCYGPSFERHYQVASGVQLPDWWPY